MCGLFLRNRCLAAHSPGADGSLHWCRCPDPTPNKGGGIRYASLSPKGGRYLYADVHVVNCGAGDTFWTLLARAIKNKKPVGEKNISSRGNPHRKCKVRVRDSHTTVLVEKPALPLYLGPGDAMIRAARLRRRWRERSFTVSPISAMVLGMSKTTASADEKQRPAHWFKPGQSGNPRGRTKGSRSKFSQAFVEDLSACWERHGIVALEKCATTEPAQFLRVCASLMPRDVDLNLSVDVVSFAASFEHALSVLGVEAPKQPKAKVIEHQVTSGPHR